MATTTRDELTTTRITLGIYKLETSDRTFEAERFPCGSWMLFETTSCDREWWNDYATLRDCKEVVRQTGR